MISPEGFIFDKESILSYIIEQKESNKRKMKIWEAQVKRDSVKQESVGDLFWIFSTHVFANVKVLFA